MSQPSIHAFAACRPVAWARPRFSRTGRAFTSARAEQGAADQAAQFARFSPREPYSGPLTLRLVYTMPRPKHGRDVAGAPHDRRPDIDNLSKLTLDVLSRLRWWADDAQVSQITASKRWAGDGPEQEPGVANERLVPPAITAQPVRPGLLWDEPTRSRLSHEIRRAWTIDIGPISAVRVDLDRDS